MFPVAWRNFLGDEGKGDETLLADWKPCRLAKVGKGVSPSFFIIFFFACVQTGLKRPHFLALR